mmetsp:Transcript_29113/g.78814  ORF Transcript_29113/g.78814 Transcript_29113/m.78814 type:complete len:368 (+) Transcript_29113:169-1272(+)|eukprot:CAMPEP_0172366276 /NCGR_PEP_ID=MMETSP1060-20121228/14576_1 /TAXON_ID=37318 /ORGANISM="Pseudo-nitzschia pungens, Strain cf. cingulata" /LENGTH=367 /DNA_ID=CAMNT_0013090061 /DNA_START=143 /DNA_END=1246 /DNA_ORIENTATION=+
MVPSILCYLFGCSLLPAGVLAFGVESFLPAANDLHAHFPMMIHQSAELSQLSTTPTIFSTLMVDSPSQSVSLIGSIDSNNLLLSSASNDNAIAIGDIASSLLSDYRKALDAEPLKVKIITGCLLAILGDAIAQSRQPEEYNKKRAGAFVAFDGVWRTVQQVTYGPIIQTCNGKFSIGLLSSLAFLNLQDELLKEDNKVILAAIEQTLVSQLVLIPLLYYPIFYAVTGVVQNLTTQETITRAKETFIPLMKRNLLFWIPVQFGAFYFVEENLQIPVLTACGLVWTVILSVSAGNVNQSSSEEKDDVNEIGVEEKMVLESGANKGAVGLGTSSFFFRSSATADDDGSDAILVKSSTTKQPAANKTLLDS